MSAQISGLLIVVEHTGERIPNTSVDSKITSNELINTLSGKLNLPRDTRGVLIRKLTHKQLLPTQSLESAGIQDREILIVNFERTAGGGIPIHSYRDIQIINTYLNRDQILTYHHYALYGIILYTSADENIASFIRSNFLELHYLCGSNFAFYVVEKPNPDWLPSIREELTKNLGSTHMADVWDSLDKSHFSSMNSSAVYDIASHIGIKYTQLPCIIFFSNLNDKELLVVPFSSLTGVRLDKTSHQDFLVMFREIFDKIGVAIKKPEHERLKTLEQEIIRLKGHRASSKIQEIIFPEAVKGLIGAIIKILIV